MLPRKYCLVGVHFSLTRRMANFRCTRWRYLFARWQPKIECIALCILDRSATKSSFFGGLFDQIDPFLLLKIQQLPVQSLLGPQAYGERHGLLWPQVRLNSTMTPSQSIHTIVCIQNIIISISNIFITYTHTERDIYTYGDSENYISMWTPSFFIFATAHRIWGFHHHHAASQW